MEVVKLSGTNSQHLEELLNTLYHHQQTSIVKLFKGNWYQNTAGYNELFALTEKNEMLNTINQN